VVSSDYSRVIATLRDRQRAAPSDPAVAGLAKRLGSLAQEALFAGKFVGDGRYLLLFRHPDGRLLTFNVFFDEVNEFAGEFERFWALRIGSRRHPELAAWIPPRPPEGAVTYADCGGADGVRAGRTNTSARSATDAAGGMARLPSPGRPGGGGPCAESLDGVHRMNRRRDSGRVAGDDGASLRHLFR
jgi:hypothetical protein